MKRWICPQHINYVGKGRSVNIDAANCVVCRRNEKVGPLRVALAFKEAADDLEFVVEHPDYDPMGITIQTSATKAITLYLRMIHPAYGKNLVDKMKEILDGKTSL